MAYVVSWTTRSDSCAPDNEAPIARVLQVDSKGSRRVTRPFACPLPIGRLALVSDLNLGKLPHVVRLVGY
jgi:hypothetical protein